MRFFLPIACVLTFCIVCFGHSDAIIPFGYLLFEFLKDDSISFWVRFLLLIPFAATLLPLLVTRISTRSLLTIAGVSSLTLLWVFGIFAYVVYPMPGNQISNWVPAITSIPFVLTVIAVTAHSIRGVRTTG